jgi:hypothetical protein
MTTLLGESLHLFKINGKTRSIQLEKVIMERFILMHVDERESIIYCTSK